MKFRLTTERLASMAENMQHARLYCVYGQRSRIHWLTSAYGRRQLRERATMEETDRNMHSGNH